MTPRILVFGSFGHQNLGDEAYVAVCLETIKSRFPSVEFCLLSYDPQDTLVRHPGVKAIETLYSRSAMEGRPRWLKMLKLVGLLPQLPMGATISKCGQSRWPLLGKQACNLIKELRASDFVLACGGGLINSDYKLGAFRTPYFIWIAKTLMGKPVALLAQSIGPIRGVAFQRWCRFALEQVDLLTLREEYSLNWLDNIGLQRSRAVVTACPAVLLRPSRLERVQEIMALEGLKQVSCLVGFSIRRWHHPFSSQAGAKHRYLTDVLSVADILIEQLNANVVFVPTTPEDVDVSIEMLGKMKHREQGCVIRGSYSPSDIKGIIGETDVFVTSNYHPLLFSTSMGVPTICLSYTGHKSAGHMKLLRQESNVIEIDDLTIQTLLSRVRIAWQQREQITEQLRAEQPNIERRASLNFELLFGLIDDVLA